MALNLDIFRTFGRQPQRASEELFEWIALLESVDAARDSFAMVELGAGYGRWTAHAANALRSRHPDMPARFVAVEAEPSHFNRIQSHLKDNGLNPAACRLINAPVNGHRGLVYFTVGHPEEWYGQSILPSADHGFGNWPKAKVVRMRAITIEDAIAGLDGVDLIDMDIQGAELTCVEHSLGTLSRKVRRLFIATHSSDIHDAIRNLLQRAGWLCRADYAPQAAHETEFGLIKFQDGVHYWENSGVLGRALHNCRWRWCGWLPFRQRLHGYHHIGIRSQTLYPQQSMRASLFALAASFDWRA
jgi:FkbM family methyltransferase